MKTFYHLLGFVGACLLSVLSGFGQASPNENEMAVRWAQPEYFPPLFISSGPSKGEGIGDRIYQDAKALLPQFNHVDFYANNPRIVAEFRKQTNICALLHYTAERDAFMVFSKPVVLLPAPQIFINADNSKAFASFNKSGSWSVSKADVFAKDRGLVLGHIPNRSYGKDLDKALKDYENTLAVQKVFSSPEARVKMLLAQRVDYIVEYPWLMAYEMKKLKSHIPLRQVSISDAPTHVPGRLGCPKTAWGSRVIGLIDEVADEIYARSVHYVAKWSVEPPANSP